jgi:hypothetical protein
VNRASTRHELRLYGLGRSYAFDRALTRRADIVVWSAVEAVLHRRTYRFGSAHVELKIDWSQAASEMRRQVDLPTLEELVGSRQSITITVQDKPYISVPITATWKGRGRQHAVPTGAFVELLLNEVYIILNLAAPGAFAIERAVLDGETIVGTRGSYLKADLLERGWTVAVETGWPPIDVLEVQAVTTWFEQLQLGLAQVATQRIEKALYSVLHLAALQVDEPITVIWLAQCIEAIFDTPPTGSFGILVKRIEALLGQAPAKALRTNLRRFYDARNAFSHGGAPVIHPMMHDGLDPRVSDVSQMWVPPAEFGAALVIAVLQVHIVNCWREVAWREVPSGVTP